MKKGIKKRVARIKAKGEATGKEARQLARQRAGTYRAARSLNPREMETVRRNTKIMKRAKKARGEYAGGTYRDEVQRVASSRRLKPIKTVKPKALKKVKKSGKPSAKAEIAAARARINTEKYRTASNARSKLNLQSSVDAEIRNAAGIARTRKPRML